MQTYEKNSYLRRMWQELTDLVMPRECLVCGRRLGAAERELCLWCAADLPLTYNWERPHHPMADSLNALLEERRESQKPFPYVYAASLLLYHHENPFKRIPQAVKYHDKLSTGRYFAHLLGQHMAAQPHFADIDTVIPVPLHWWRRWKRGYNQAEVIAGELAKSLNATLRTDVLKRRRATKSQTKLDEDARRANVQGAFQVRKTIDAAHLLLVDDTFTTGATLAECWWTLHQALGPSVRISVASLSLVESD